MRFVKMHGLGNDFILIDDRGGAIADEGALARTLCSRRTGIGADGLILVRSSDVADARMAIFNSDGSEAEMCGNGIRCFGKFVFEAGIAASQRMRVETPAGIMALELQLAGGAVVAARVDMGKPSFERAHIPMLGEGSPLMGRLRAHGKWFTASSALMGVPHTVVFVEDAARFDVARFGPPIEAHPLFPRRTNVDFVTVIDEKTIAMRTWERGCGATLACGTGAAAAAACCAAAGLTLRSVDVRLQLGELHIDWAEDDHVYLSGPAAAVFEGSLLPPL